MIIITCFVPNGLTLDSLYYNSLAEIFFEQGAGIEPALRYHYCVLLVRALTVFPLRHPCISHLI